MAPSQLKLNAAAFDACNRAIIVSGCGRSGTTILGQALHSMERVEYCFEGATLISLFASIDYMQREQWMLLYETYLYEDFLIGALAGRSLNCNRGDDSSIYKVKEAGLIESRLKESKRKQSAVIEAAQGVVAYKVPEIVPFLKRATEYYPGSRVVLLYRNPGDTLNSILRKRWFSDESLQAGVVIWPSRLVRGMHIPYWLPESDVEDWIRCDEIHRAAQYYLRMVRAFRELKSAVAINYDGLIDSPEQVIRELAARLELSFGPKTEEIIASIKKTDSPRADILEQVDPKVRAQLKAIYEEAGYLIKTSS